MGGGFTSWGLAGLRNHGSGGHPVQVPDVRFPMGRKAVVQVDQQQGQLVESQVPAVRRGAPTAPNGDAEAAGPRPWWAPSPTASRRAGPGPTAGRTPIPASRRRCSRRPPHGGGRRGHPRGLQLAAPVSPRPPSRSTSVLFVAGAWCRSPCCSPVTSTGLRWIPARPCGPGGCRDRPRPGHRRHVPPHATPGDPGPRRGPHFSWPRPWCRWWSLSEVAAGSHRPAPTDRHRRSAAPRPAAGGQGPVEYLSSLGLTVDGRRPPHRARRRSSRDEDPHEELRAVRRGHRPHPGGVAPRGGPPRRTRARALPTWWSSCSTTPASPTSAATAPTSPPRTSTGWPPAGCATPTST